MREDQNPDSFADICQYLSGIQLPRLLSGFVTTIVAKVATTTSNRNHETACVSEQDFAAAVVVARVLGRIIRPSCIYVLGAMVW